MLTDEGVVLMKVIKCIALCSICFSFCCSMVNAEDTVNTYSKNTIVEQIALNELCELSVDEKIMLSEKETELLNKLSQKSIDGVITISTTPDIDYLGKKYRILEVQTECLSTKYDVLPPNASLFEAIEYSVRKILNAESDKTCKISIYEAHTVQCIDFYEKDYKYVSRGINSFGHVKIISEQSNFVLTEENHYENIPLVEVVIDTDFGKLKSASDLLELSYKYSDSFFENARYDALIKELPYNKFQKIYSIIH